MKHSEYDKLKDLLLRDEKETQDSLVERLDKLDRTLNQRQELEPKIQPIIEDNVVYLQKNFPELFGPAITDSIRRQINDSQDEVVDALYPIMGKMIKKYIAMEFQLLSDRIDKQLDDAFSPGTWWIWIKSWFGEVDVKDVVLAKSLEARIEEIYVIQQGSGILLGSYSIHETMDRDMIAGMFTAIKSFASDALTTSAQEIEEIDYEEYKLVLKNLKTFYVAVVVTGIINTEFKSKLDDFILTFAGDIQKALRKGEEADKIEASISEGVEKAIQGLDD